MFHACSARACSHRFVPNEKNINGRYFHCQYTDAVIVIARSLFIIFVFQRRTACRVQVVRRHSYDPGTTTRTHPNADRRRRRRRSTYGTNPGQFFGRRVYSADRVGGDHQRLVMHTRQSSYATVVPNRPAYRERFEAVSRLTRDNRGRT